MEIILALTVGGLYAAAIYMMLRRSIAKFIIGLVLLGHATHLLILTVGRTVRGAPPLIAGNADKLTPIFADPTPQALILTAIVISFGVQAFALVLIKRVYQTQGTGDVDRMRATDRLEAI
ncbi:Na+/H+ antiporter subunit C [Chloroflexi bacterium TSY]|nr:Na+/H+ antiporter subunit C [Chloroflexi bacterium TSY]